NSRCPVRPASPAHQDQQAKFSTTVFVCKSSSPPTTHSRSTTFEPSLAAKTTHREVFMRLISQKAFLLFVLSALACSDTGGPGAVRARFDLDNIDGRSLPTYPAATPGLTPTILSNTVILNDDGHAAIIEHRTQWNGV